MSDFKRIMLTALNKPVPPIGAGGGRES